MSGRDLSPDAVGGTQPRCDAASHSGCPAEVPSPGAFVLPRYGAVGSWLGGKTSGSFH
jgi:hypothetical protein